MASERSALVGAKRAADNIHNRSVRTAFIEVGRGRWEVRHDVCAELLPKIDPTLRRLEPVLGQW